MTCDDGEGEGEVNQAHHTTRQHAMPCRAFAPQRGFRGDWERGEDDGNSGRTPLRSPLTFNRLLSLCFIQFH